MEAEGFLIFLLLLYNGVKGVKDCSFSPRGLFISWHCL